MLYELSSLLLLQVLNNHMLYEPSSLLLLQVLNNHMLYDAKFPPFTPSAK